MSRRVILILSCALLLLFLLLAGAGSIGYFLAKPFSSGGLGQDRPSPDGKWIARALTYQERSLLGARRVYSELRIETPAPSPRTVRQMIICDTAEPTIDWQQEGEIFWNRNSASVTFKCVTGKANLAITLTP